MVSYTYEAKCVLLNRWRTLHYMEWSKIRNEWKDAFGWAYKANPVVFDSPVDITVVHEVKGRRCDPVACAECYKAALDGLVLQGMIPDDSGDWVNSVTFLAPEKTSRDAITLIVEKPGRKS